MARCVVPPAIAATLAAMLAVVVATGVAAAPLPCAGLLSPSLVPRLASIATENIDAEYPNLIHHVMQSDADVLPPRRLTPAFFGSFDWHSAVHSHWQMGEAAMPKRDARAGCPTERD